MSVPDAAPESGFVDTNVWLYAFIEGDDPQKTARTTALRCVTHHDVLMCPACTSESLGVRTKLAPGLVMRLVDFRRCQTTNGCSLSASAVTKFDKERDMPTADSTANNAAQVRKVIELWAKAIRAKDVEGAMACFAPDVLTFDLAPSLQYTGREVIRKGLEDSFSTWDRPIGLEIRDLRVTADGEKPPLWCRSTMCSQKIDGTWRIAHEHTSTPFYMDGTAKAALDLKP
jgi:PhnB protein